MVANGGTDRTDFINELLIANKSSGRAKESRGKLCLSSRNFEGYQHFFLHLGHEVAASFFFKTESTFMGCEREMGCFSYWALIVFFQVGRLPLLLVRFLFFNIISESSFQPISRGMTLIQSHCYEVLIRINREIVTLLCPDSVTVNFSFYITLTISFLSERSIFTPLGDWL